jgi:hypothetical protein
LQINAAALGDGMATELNKNLASKGLTAQVTATATDQAAGSGRRLQQAGGSYGGYGGQPPAPPATCPKLRAASTALPRPCLASGTLATPALS